MCTLPQRIHNMLVGTVLLMASFGTVTAGPSSSMIAQLDFETGATVVNVDVADLLRSKGDVVLKPFEKLMTKLARADKSPCETETELRLITVCRSLEGSVVDDAQTTAALEAVRSLYGIRKAICEAGISGVQTPTSCQKLLPTTSFDMSKKSMARSELDFAKSGLIPGCLRKFQEHHYFWTSYSNNRQEASDIIHLLRSDIEAQSMVMIYRDLTESMNGFRNDFDIIREESGTWFDTARQKVQDLFDMQEQVVEYYDQGFGNVSSTFVELSKTFASVSDMVDDTVAVLHELSSAANTEVSQLAEEISTISHRVGSMKMEIADMFSSAAVEIATFTQSQMDTVDDVLHAVADKSVAVTTVMNGLEAVLVESFRHAELVEVMHSGHIDKLQEQDVLTDMILIKQHAQVDLLDQVDETIQQWNQTLAAAQELNSTISSMADLFELFRQYEQVILVVCVYVAICLVLAPFDGNVVSPKVVSDIKTGYWALQAAIFLLGKLHLPNKFAKAQDIIQDIMEASPLTLVFWLAVVITVIGFTATTFHYFKFKRIVSDKVDVEQVPVKQYEKSRILVRICDSQRQRFKAIPRKARHGSAPPGL